MTLSEEALNAQLNREVRYFNSVDSTNDIAILWLQEGAPAGSVVIADEQRAGRGRNGRTWYTPPGSALALSIVLKPVPELSPRISMVGALAVAELCDSLNLGDVGIKWPNDVQINGKKVSGVLPEAVWESANLVGVVLGIGVNVRVRFDPQLEATATSLESESGKTLDRNTLIVTLLERVDYWMTRIESDTLPQVWQSRITTIGQRVQVGDIVGMASGVGSDGSLLITMVNGSIRRVLAGDISLLD